MRKLVYKWDNEKKQYSIRLLNREEQIAVEKLYDELEQLKKISNYVQKLSDDEQNELDDPDKFNIMLFNVEEALKKYDIYVDIIKYVI